jgi:hypothetical protein
VHKIKKPASVDEEMIYEEDIRRVVALLVGGGQLRRERRTDEVSRHAVRGPGEAL